MMLRMATLILVAGALVPAAPKNRDWQTGTLLDAEHNTYFARGYSTDNTTVPLVDAMNESGGHSGNVAAAGNLSDYVFDKVCGR